MFSELLFACPEYIRQYFIIAIFSKGKEIINDYLLIFKVEGVEKYPFDEESIDIETFQPTKMTGFVLLHLKIDQNLNPFCLLSGNPDRSPLVIRPKRSLS